MTTSALPDGGSPGITTTNGWYGICVPAAIQRQAADILSRRAGRSWHLCERPFELARPGNDTTAVVVMLRRPTDAVDLERVRDLAMQTPRQVWVLYDPAAPPREHVHSIMDPWPFAWTIAEAIEIEKASGGRLELVGGQLLAMAGGTPHHAHVIGWVLHLLHEKLPAGSPCFPSSSELRIGHPDDDQTFRSPDAVVICGDEVTHPSSPQVVTNPTVWIEVLSKSNTGKAFQEKLDWVRSLPSVQQLILIGFRPDQITTETRLEGGAWQSDVHRAGDSVEVHGVGTLAVSRIYERFPNSGKA